MSPLAFVALALGLAFGPACASSSSSPASAETGTFSAIYPLIFPVTTKAQCNFCHGLPPNDKSNGKLSVGADKAAAYAALVGKTSSSGLCSGKTLVVAGEPDASLFLAKVSGTPPCGGHMPLGGDPLTAAQIELIRSWIAAGAKDD